MHVLYVNLPQERQAQHVCFTNDFFQLWKEEKMEELKWHHTILSELLRVSMSIGNHVCQSICWSRKRKVNPPDANVTLFFLQRERNTVSVTTFG